MKRGEIWWYEFPSPNKRRPVLILTRDASIAVLNAITVAEITRTVRGVRSELVIGTEDGMPYFSCANFYHLHTVPKQKLEERIATLSTDKMKEADRALCYALGISELDGKQVAEASTEYVTGAENANAVIPEGMSEEDEWVGVEVESESL